MFPHGPSGCGLDWYDLQSGEYTEWTTRYDPLLHVCGLYVSTRFPWHLHNVLERQFLVPVIVALAYNAGCCFELVYVGFTCGQIRYVI